MKSIHLILIIASIIIFSNCKEEEVRTSILGSWNVEEFSDLTPRKYQVNITRNYYDSESENKYIINNFHYLGNTETSEVYVQEFETGILTITGTASISNSFSGTGTIAPDFSLIEWNYKVNDGISNPTVVANYY